MAKVIEIATPQDKVIVAKFSGNFDESSIDENAPRLTETLDEISAPSLIFDFTDLEYVNSRGIGELAAWYTHVTDRAGKVFYFGVSDAVRDTFEMVRFTDIFEEVSSLEEAISKIKGE